MCIRDSSAAAKAVLTISGGEVEQMGFIAVKNDDNSILNVTGGVKMCIRDRVCGIIRDWLHNKR